MIKFSFSIFSLFILINFLYIYSFYLYLHGQYKKAPKKYYKKRWIIEDIAMRQEKNLEITESKIIPQKLLITT